MLDALSILSVLFTAKDYVKEKLEKPIAGRFDWDMYYADLHRGIDPMEQIKKVSAGSYYTVTAKPCTRKIIVQEFDEQRYNADKELFGEFYAEEMKKCNKYNWCEKTICE